MAPHWKCGSGQPVAGSNPALSANYAPRSDGRWLRWRLCSSLTHPQVRSLRCSPPPFQRPPYRRTPCIRQRRDPIERHALDGDALRPYSSGRCIRTPGPVERHRPGPSAGWDSPFCPADSTRRPAGGPAVLGRLTRRFGAGAAAVGLILTLLSTPAAALAHPPLLLGLNLLPPIGAPDSYTTPYETRLDIDKPGVLANDTDLDSSTLYAELVSGTSHGTLELREEGRIRYQPDNGFSGTDKFTYRPYDGTFYAVLAVTVTITVKPRPTPTPTPKPTATPAPTPTPSPTAAPTTTPTPAPTPTPTPRPTLAVPTLPVPTLPLPTIVFPGLPTPTPTPTPTAPPSGTDPTPAPDASVGPSAAPTPEPDSSTSPFQHPGPTSSAGPAAVAAV